MVEGLTSQLPTTNKKLADPKQKLRHSRVFWIVAVILVIIMISAGIFFWVTGHKSSLPPAIVSAAGFPLYYPSPLPKNYSYRAGSAKLTNGGLVFYQLANGQLDVTVSEQPTPANPPSLSNILGFKKLSTPTGDGIIGSLGTSPTVIIIGNTTLLNINGSSKVPAYVVSEIAQNMQVLSH